MRLTLKTKGLEAVLEFTAAEAAEFAQAVPAGLAEKARQTAAAHLASLLDQWAAEDREAAAATPTAPTAETTPLSADRFQGLLDHVYAALGASRDDSVPLEMVYWTTWKEGLQNTRQLDLIDFTVDVGDVEAVREILGRRLGRAQGEVEGDYPFFDFYDDQGRKIARASTAPTPGVVVGEQEDVTLPGQPTDAPVPVEEIAAARPPIDPLAPPAQPPAADAHARETPAQKAERIYLTKRAKAAETDPALAGGPAVDVPATLQRLNEWIAGWVQHGQEPDGTNRVLRLAQDREAVTLCSYLGGLVGAADLLGCDLAAPAINWKPVGHHPWQPTWRDTIIAATTVAGTLPMVPSEVAAALRS
jgi:hypothetical protein